MDDGERSYLTIIVVRSAQLAEARLFAGEPLIFTLFMQTTTTAQRIVLLFRFVFRGKHCSRNPGRGHARRNWEGACKGERSGC